jgi:hypothetical protein
VKDVPPLPGQPADVPPTPGDRTAEQDGALSRKVVSGFFEEALRALAQTFCPRKLGFFIVSLLVATVIFGILTLAAVGLGMTTEETMPTAMIIGLAVIYAVGHLGVTIAGVAHMAHWEVLGQKVGVVGAARFCGQRFPGYFAAAVLVVLSAIFVSCVVNGAVYLLNKEQYIGALIGTLLYIPHFLFNAALPIALVVLFTLMPVAMATDRLSILSTAKHLAITFWRNGPTLAVQVVVTGILAAIASGFLFTILGLGFVATEPSHAVPSIRHRMAEFEASSAAPGVFDNFAEPLQRDTTGIGYEPAPEPSGRFSWGWLRAFFQIAILLAALAFPMVFWICAFTRYYVLCLPRPTLPLPAL